MKLPAIYRTTLISIILLVFYTTCLSQSFRSNLAITPGTLTFTVKTITNNTTYSPRNVIAIWIKDAQGNFVVSRKVMANKRKNHLVKWNSSSVGNTVTAITGSTLGTHESHTVTWDGKNASGMDMPDGTYQIWVEYSSTNSASNGNQGPSLSVEFTKGSDAQHITPANGAYYQNIVADWVPLTTGLNNLSKSGASVKIYPNPFGGETTVQLICEKPSQAFICVFDGSGKKVTELLNDSFSSGTRIYTWDGTSDKGQKLINGMYLIHIQINGFTETQKVIINR